MSDKNESGKSSEGSEPVPSLTETSPDETTTDETTTDGVAAGDLSQKPSDEEVDASAAPEGDEDGSDTDQIADYDDPEYPDEAAGPAEPPESEPIDTEPATSDAYMSDTGPTEAEPIELDDTDPVEHSGSSFASTALLLLLLIIGVAGLTLWGAPKLAPYLPGPVAKYLNPIPSEAQSQIDALKARLDEIAPVSGEVAGLDQRLAALEAASAEGSDTAQAAAAEELAGAANAAATQAQESADAANDALGGVQAQVQSLGADIKALDGELRALTSSLSATSGETGGADLDVAAADELKAALQALQSRVDSLAERVSVIPDLLPRSETDGFVTGAELSSVQEDLAARIAEIGQAAEDAKVTGNDALTEAQTAVREAALRGLATTLRARVSGGLPYAGALTEIETLSGSEAPEALKEPATSGLATQARLIADFDAAARAAVAADRSASAGDDVGSKITSWLGSQVSTRPTAPTEGDTTAAIVSRMEAALSEGDLAAALTEAEALPEPARAGMQNWLTRASVKVEAEAALESYLSATGGQG